MIAMPVNPVARLGRGGIDRREFHELSLLSRAGLRKSAGPT